jgi:hypothetical protein
MSQDFKVCVLRPQPVVKDTNKVRADRIEAARMSLVEGLV